MLEVRKNLLEMQNSTPSARFSLQEVNLICSEMCRNHLHEVYHRHSELFDGEFSKIQTIYKKLDRELLKRNAIEAEILITFTQNSLKNMKKALTNRWLFDIMINVNKVEKPKLKKEKKEEMKND